MALLHAAQLSPSKLEVLSSWLPGKSWAGMSDGAAAGDLELVGTYRFDDPAGDVGIETLLVRGGSEPLLQVPLTYRSAPVDALSPWFVATMEHSALGTRWVYDACGDAVYVNALASTILCGGRQADLEMEVDGRLELVTRPNTAQVVGDGTLAAGSMPPLEVVAVVDSESCAIRAGIVDLRIARHVGALSGLGASLTGTWPGSDEPTLLASAILIG